MNAHSAYRKKGYKVATVKQSVSDNNIPLQLIDVLMGMIVFLLEKSYRNDSNVTTLIKKDLIYRLLIHNNNLNKLHEKVTLFKWREEYNEIETIALSEFTGEFLIHKTMFDVQEMKRLSRIISLKPDVSKWVIEIAN